MATSIIRPVHAGIDVPYDLPIDTNEWTESGGRYVHVYTDNRITQGCRVEVTFKGGTLNTDVLYIEFEKITNGINFIVSEIPEVAVPIIIHIINAQTGTVLIPNADQIATVGTAQTLGANVNNALVNINDDLIDINDHISEMRTTHYIDMTTLSNSRINTWHNRSARICGNLICVDTVFVTKNSSTTQSSGYEKIAEYDLSDYLEEDEEFITSSHNQNVVGTASGKATGNTYVYVCGVDSNHKLFINIFQYGDTSVANNVRTSVTFPFKRKKTS